MLEGVVEAKILELRFPFAGRVEWVGVAVGDRVKRGQALARLDASQLKKRHQKELKDYEKIRATFEQLKKRLEASTEPDKKYLMDRAQADLEVAVLAVEIAEYQVGETGLRSPADGIVVDDGNLAARINITPASFAVKIIVDGSYWVRAKLPQPQIAQIEKDQLAEFTAVAFPDRRYKGRLLRISSLPPDRRSKDFAAIIVLEHYDGLRFGMVGDVQIKTKV